MIQKYKNGIPYATDHLYVRDHAELKLLVGIAITICINSSKKIHILRIGQDKPTTVCNRFPEDMKIDTLYSDVPLEDICKLCILRLPKIHEEMLLSEKLKHILGKAHKHQKQHLTIIK